MVFSAPSLKNCFAILWLFLLDFRAFNHGVKGPQKPKTYCDNSNLAILSFNLTFIVRSGPVWRQDLAILSPEAPRDSTCQLRRGRESRNSCFSLGPSDFTDLLFPKVLVIFKLNQRFELAVTRSLRSCQFCFLCWVPRSWRTNQLRCLWRSAISGLKTLLRLEWMNRTSQCARPPQKPFWTSPLQS